MKYEWRITDDVVQMILVPESTKDWRIIDIITDSMQVTEIRKPVRESQTQEQAVLVFVQAYEGGRK